MWRHVTQAPSVIAFDDAHAEEFSDDLAADLRIVVYTVAPGSEDASKLERLSVGGTQDLTRPTAHP